MGANGATVIWVGIPNDDNPEVTAKLKIQDEAVRAEAAERGNVVFIDTWNRFSGRDGNWAEFVIDPRDGVGKDVRADDGFHLNTNGAEILALDIAQAIRDQLRTRRRHLTGPARPDLAFASRFLRPVSPKSRRKRAWTALLLLAAGLDGGSTGGDLIGAEIRTPPGPAVAGLDLPGIVVGGDLRVRGADLADAGLVVADDVERRVDGSGSGRRAAPHD